VPFSLGGSSSRPALPVRRATVALALVCRDVVAVRCVVVGAARLLLAGLGLVVATVLVAAAGRPGVPSTVVVLVVVVGDALYDTSGVAEATRSPTMQGAGSSNASNGAGSLHCGPIDIEEEVSATPRTREQMNGIDRDRTMNSSIARVEVGCEAINRPRQLGNTETSNTADHAIDDE